mgnify:CR=1 FL=1
MSNLRMINRTPSRLSHSATHNLSEIPLVLCVERDDAGLCGADDELTGFEDSFAGLLL